ncbi:MAG: helix-turn-helix domain-containing protein [Terriglobales bacterium]
MDEDLNTHQQDPKIALCFRSEKLLLSKREAAHLLSVSSRTIDYLIARQQLPIRRIGRRTLIPKRALELFARRDHLTCTGGEQ